jgi:hypothetical protein
MPSYKELAEQGIEVEVDALGHCCAKQGCLKPLKESRPARLANDLCQESCKGHLDYKMGTLG